MPLVVVHVDESFDDVLYLAELNSGYAGNILRGHDQLNGERRRGTFLRNHPLQGVFLRAPGN